MLPLIRQCQTGERLKSKTMPDTRKRRRTGQKSTMFSHGFSSDPLVRLKSGFASRQYWYFSNYFVVFMASFNIVI